MKVIYQLENFNGNYDFRCRSHDGWMMESHLHEYSELLYCRKGMCDIIVNGKQIHLPEQHLVWIPPNYIHQYIQTDASVICAVFSNDFIPLLSHVLNEKQFKPTAVSMAGMHEIPELLPTLPHDNLLRICSYLHLICAAVMEQSELESAQPGDGELCRKVISYLSSHFREPISLKSVARKFGYHEKYLSHSLHQLTGIHFTRLVALYRIEHAKKLLCTEKDMTASQIALACGFSAINTFNRAFRASTGMTPLQFRKAFRL